MLPPPRPHDAPAGYYTTSDKRQVDIGGLPVLAASTSAKDSRVGAGLHLLILRRSDLSVRALFCTGAWTPAALNTPLPPPIYWSATHKARESPLACASVWIPLKPST